MISFSRVTRCFVFLALASLARTQVEAAPNILKNARHDTSAPLSQLIVGAGAPSPQTDREMAEPRATRAPLASGRADAVASPPTGALTGVTTVMSFDGQSAADNRRVFGFAFVPPDTNGAVGDKQYVQMVNVT